MDAEEKLQARIDALPKDHVPWPYEVLIFDKRDRLINTRYVRASSVERAALTGYKVDRYLFRNKKGYRASAYPMWGDPPKTDYDAALRWERSLDVIKENRRINGR